MRTLIVPEASPAVGCVHKSVELAELLWYAFLAFGGPSTLLQLVEGRCLSILGRGFAAKSSYLLLRKASSKVGDFRGQLAMYFD